MSSERLLALPVDAMGVNGTALARGKHAIGFRAIPLLPGFGRLDGKILMGHIRSLGPSDPDGAYHTASFAIPATTAALRRVMRCELYQENSIPVPDFAPGESAELRIEWCFDGAAVRARVSCDRVQEILLLLNGCVDSARVVSGDRRGATLEQGNWQVAFAWRGTVAGDFRTGGNLDVLESKVRGYCDTVAAGAELGAIRATVSPETPLYVAMVEAPATGDVPVEPDPAEIDRALAAGRADWETRRMSSTGAAADCADALDRLIGFSAAYDPRNGKRYLPVNRDWAGVNRLPPVFMWDNFLDSYLGSFGNPALGMESLSHILDVIAAQGIAGAPPQRNLVIPIVYSKMVRFIGDDAFTRDSFPKMLAFMKFWFADRGDGHPWRDGNDDGLIESGSCLQVSDGVPPGRVVSDAMDETGYDDSPMYSAGFAHGRMALFADGVTFDFTRGTLNLTLIGQNSLYVAGCRALAVVGDDLGRGDDSAWLRREADRVAERIREKLYNPAAGIYLNRFFNGEFSPVRTPDIFSPLTAGIPDAATAARLHAILRDPNEFWGESVIPTVSYSDPAFNDDPLRDTYWKGNYWRGNIWAPTNYITYLALRGTDWDATRHEFRAKSRRLFMDDWLAHCHANENYPPFGATHASHMFCGNGGRDPHYIWAGLLPLIALEELFSVEDTVPGLRFGGVDPAAFGSWRNFVYHGARGAVEISAQGVNLDLGDALRVTADAPAAFREFVAGPRKITFRYRAVRGTNLTVRMNGKSWEAALPATGTWEYREIVR